MLNFLCLLILFIAVKTDSKLILHHMGKIFYYLSYRDKILNMEGDIFLPQEIIWDGHFTETLSTVRRMSYWPGKMK